MYWFVPFWSKTKINCSLVYARCSTLSECFPSFGKAFMFATGWLRLHYFAMVVTRCMFSHVWHQLHVSASKSSSLVCQLVAFVKNGRIEIFRLKV